MILRIEYDNIRVYLFQANKKEMRGENVSQVQFFITGIDAADKCNHDPPFLDAV